MRRPPFALTRRPLHASSSQNTPAGSQWTPRRNRHTSAVSFSSTSRASILTSSRKYPRLSLPAGRWTKLPKRSRKDVTAGGVLGFGAKAKQSDQPSGVQDRAGSNRPWQTDHCASSTGTVCLLWQTPWRHWRLTARRTVAGSQHPASRWATARTAGSAKTA